METINLEDLRSGIAYTGDLIIDSTFLLLPKSADVSEDLIKALKTWEFTSVICDGDISLNNSLGVTAAKEEESDSPKEKISENVKKALETSKNVQVGNSDKNRIEMVHQVYNEYMNYIELVFTHYATHKEIDQEELSDTVQELCIFIKEHRRYILRVNSAPEAGDKNFLVVHSMRTTVLAIAIGLQLHLPLSKMIELGVTCILHEIGMLRLPPQLYMTSRKLNPSEKAQISKHTVFGYSIIKDLEFSLPIQLGVLEHHEKENGTGYPRKMTGDKISSNAKIIAVACTYEAISSPRSYKDERSTFDALVELIQNKNHSYDDAVLKGLLDTVSLYPIGTYVYLSNRKVAVVIDTNPDNPKFPVVQLLTEKEEDGSLKVIPTEKDGITILRILSKQEQQDILKIVEEKYENIANAQKEQEQKEAENASMADNKQPVPEQAVQAPQKADIPAAESSNAPTASTNTESSDDGTVEVDISMFS